MFNVKKFKIVVLVFAILVVVSTNISVLAVSDSTENPYEPVRSNSPLFSQCFYDGAGNMYAECVWGSFAAAQAYYGYDLTYSRCNVYYAGKNYNYCYSFSDTTYCYFRVRK